LINVTYALVLRVIMLNNNIKILLVSFVHHIELQNFLNALVLYDIVLSDFIKYLFSTKNKAKDFVVASHSR